MYYLGGTIANDYAIGLATSPDGITWTKCPTNPVLDAGPPGTWDSLKIVGASVCFDGSTYYLWYTGTNGAGVAVGVANSQDGVAWTKYSGNPVLAVGPTGSWDDLAVQSPAVVKVGSVFHMFYDGNHVSPGYAFRVGYAFSSDGIHWTKYNGNPVLSIGNPSEWDGHSLGTLAVLYRGRKFHLWYSGLGQSPTYPQYWQTGYASSDSTLVSVSPQADLPSDYLLSQCYPNPFNPSTTISYELPKQTHVTLKVYDVLGREVTTMVDCIQEPGYKAVRFDGTNLASGVYFYRLKAGEFSETGKMSLMK